MSRVLGDEYWEHVDDSGEKGEAPPRGEQPNVGQLGPDNAAEAEEAGYWEGMKEKGVKSE